MKKMKAVLWIAVLSCLLFSCNHGLLKDPRLYNAKKKSAGGDSAITVAPEPELQLTGGVDAFDLLDEWYNQSEEGGFPATEFENMSLVGTYFNNENVPVYAMAAGNVWQPGDSSKSEFVHAKAPDTTGQGYGISNVYWYSYRGRNPLYAADGAYNTQLQVTAEGNPKLNRFYFYRFTGDTLSPSLDNFLFAVDTYSKFMFAFAYPTKMESVFGNNVPKAWGPTDGSAFLGTSYQFYMYDPVGYVEKVDGKYNVVMYDWFKNNLAKGIYQPTLGGLNDKSQGTAYTEEAKKEAGGQGKSPFNNHTVDFFAQNLEMLAGRIFYGREKLEDGSDGLVLYKYSIGSDGTTLTRTAESWNGLETTTDLSEKTYKITEKSAEDGGSATKGSITLENGDVVDFELADESRTMILGNGEKAVSNFNDPGPAFIQRVKHNPEYENGDTKYVFSDDGKTLTMTYKNLIGQEKTKTFTYEKQESNTQARYSGYLVEFSAKDNVIESSTVANVAVWASVMEYKAFLKRDASGITSFTDAVKGLEFSYRQANDYGLDLSLMTLKFSEDGKKVTLYETLWGKAQEATSITDVDVVDGSSKTSGTIGGKSVTLTLPETGSWILNYEGEDYFLGFDDHGPSFVNRVKYDPVYVSDDGKTVYRFSNNGKTMRMTSTGDTYLGFITVGNFDYVYNFEELVNTDDKNTSRAIYGSKDALLYYAGFELSESDMLIKASKTSGAGTGTFAWDMTHAARRDANTGDIPTEEDLNYFYESMKNKSFYTRNVENGVAGLDLLTWRFEEGRAVKHTKQTWLSGTTEPVVTFPEEAKLVAVSKTSGTIMLEDGTRYTFTLNDSADSVLVETRTVNGGTTSNTYYTNYNDKGPGFINRVKGKTYQTGKNSYSFDSTGKTLTMNGSKYYYCDERDAETGRSRAVYKWNDAQFYGLELSNDDKTIEMTPSSSYGTPQWWFLGWTATRTN